jgi:hypothetical protein
MKRMMMMMVLPFVVVFSNFVQDVNMRYDLAAREYIESSSFSINGPELP